MNELKKGWLSPTAEFIETGLYEHLLTAEDICDKLGLQRYYIDGLRGERLLSYEDVLIINGWVSITKSELDHSWNIYWKEHMLTPEQIKFIKPYVEDDHINISSKNMYEWEIDNE